MFEKAYNGETIALVALYEKGIVRKDVKKLLEFAKRQGMYILCVNTKHLENTDSYKDLIDCYIERYNYGRDFGSYKTGFQHIYSRKWQHQCNRLIMLNDSVFYSQKYLDQFLKALNTTNIEVLGATENHEIEHHLGSFCISIHGRVLRKKIFHQYWDKYSNTDIRPKVIKRGEMGLSKTLKRCISSESEFSALFNMAWLSEKLKYDSDLLENITDLYRVSDFVDWKRPSLKGIARRITNRYINPETDFLGIENNEKIMFEIKNSLNSLYFIDDTKNLKKLILTLTNTKDEASLNKRVMQEVKNDLMECFTAGSQIHQNAILLHSYGLPIIKLDGMFRGMFSTADIEKLASELDEDEQIEFKSLIYSKPFGGNTLYGWKRSAFYRGLI